MVVSTVQNAAVAGVLEAGVLENAALLACRTDVLSLLVLVCPTVTAQRMHTAPTCTLSACGVHWLCVADAGVDFVTVVVCVAIAKWSCGAAAVASFLPRPCSTKGIEQALSATVLPACLWTFLLRCRSRPYTPLFFLGIGFQLGPVRSPQAFFEVGACDSLLVNPAAPFR